MVLRYLKYTLLDVLLITMKSFFITYLSIKKCYMYLNFHKKNLTKMMLSLFIP
jgi:hypothetical protein